jgi:hypothetical protein
MLIIADAKSISSFEYIGAPNPTGKPLALNSIIAPQEDPAFLMLSKYFSHILRIDLSGQNNEFFKIKLSLQLFVSQPKIPN